MIDLSRFPNIAMAAQTLGGIKETKLNKKAIAEQDQSWAALSEQEKMLIEQNLPMAKRVLNTFVTPTAILVYRSHALIIIPSRNIVWIYAHVLTQSMYFIPTSKMHDVRILTRSGQTEILSTITTGGFSKKDPAGDAINEIAQVIKPYYPGIYTNWSEQIANAASNNFAALVQSVDAQNSGVMQQYF
ncbi:MAG: DUF6709 family protein [Wujia sp.]